MLKNNDRRPATGRLVSDTRARVSSWTCRVPGDHYIGVTCIKSWKGGRKFPVSSNRSQRIEEVEEQLRKYYELKIVMQEQTRELNALRT